MPNRIIKQSICTSESMVALSWFEQVLFIRLLVSVDDYGRYDARPAIIRGSLFPLDDVTAKTVEAGIHKLLTQGMIRLYEVDGKPYLELTAWLRYNTPRAGKSKFPAPVQDCSYPKETDNICNHTQTDENICGRIPADAPDIRIRNSVSDIRYPNSGNVCPESDKAASEPPVITLLLNDKTEYPVISADISEWQELYPAVDIMQELRKMKGWCNDNPTKRKTRKGIRRFIGAWLAREQDKYHAGKGGSNGAGAKRDRKDNEFGTYL